MRRPLALCCILSLAAAAVAAENLPDWPRFRGPGQNNISPDKGLLKKWPADGPPVVWKATGLGSGYSSVTLAGNRIFTMGNQKGKSHLVCLDRDSGKKLWSAAVGPQGGNLGCTPTVDGDRVYAIGQGGDLVCADVKSGEIKWRKNFKKDFGGECGGWKYTESPLIDGDRLICTPGAKDAIMVALDKKSGEVVWKCDAPFDNAEAGYSSVVIAEVDGLKQYVQLVAAGVIGVRAKDGKFLWHYKKLGNNTANIPTPIVLGDRVFCSAGYGKGGALLKLEVEGDTATAKELYFSNRLTNKHGGLVAIDGHVYCDRDDSGMPFCADLKTGKIVWRKSERGPGRGSATLTCADGMLYFLYENGVMALVKASPKEYEEVSTFKVSNPKGRSWAHPVVVGGKLYLRQSDTLWCYNVKQQ